MRKSCLRFGLGILLLLVTGTEWLVAEKKGEVKQGYSCVFLGHSFFSPMAKGIAKYPEHCGIKGHKQVVAFGGGPNGSPGKLWQRIGENHKVRKAIRSGKVDLIGLTCYPGVGSEISDYQRWIDFALKYNPKTKFFIMIPWPRYMGRSFAEYEKVWENAVVQVRQYIDVLRKHYPNNTIFCIPQGKGMVELWRMEKEGKLNDVSGLVCTNGKKKDSYLFMDKLGHGGKVPVKMGELLWLRVIYRIDLDKPELKSKYKVDLRKLATDIADGDAYADPGPR